MLGIYIFVKVQNNTENTIGLRTDLYLSSGVFILAAAIIFSSIPMKAIVEYHDPYPQTGSRLVMESQMHGRSYWLRENAQGKFIANTGSLRSTIASISGVEYVADYLDIYNNELLISLMEPEFNLTLIWTSGQKVFDTDFSSRYNPKRVESEIFKGDYNLVNSHQINFFVVDETNNDTCPEEDSCYREDEMIKLLENSRYVVFRDLMVSTYHYSYEQ